MTDFYFISYYLSNVSAFYWQENSHLTEKGTPITERVSVTLGLVTCFLVKLGLKINLGNAPSPSCFMKMSHLKLPHNRFPLLLWKYTLAALDAAMEKSPVQTSTGALWYDSCVTRTAWSSPESVQVILMGTLLSIDFTEMLQTVGSEDRNIRDCAVCEYLQEK